MPDSAAVLIVIVSGYGTVGDKNRSIEAGADYHFLKPADPAKLLELVAIQSHFER